jgi:ATP-dependent protease ClpP protease subunit
MKLLLTVLSTLLCFQVYGNDPIVLTENNTIVMDEVYSRNTTANVSHRAQELNSELDKDEPIYLILNSGGGSIQAGLEMITFMNDLGREVKTITLWAGSMAFQTAQGLNGERIILPYGTLMSHKARGRFGGEFPGQLDNRLRYYLKRLENIDKVTVNRTNGKQTLESYRNLYENEYWCDGQDCVEAGFADRVGNVSCGESLSHLVDKTLKIPVQSRRGLSTLEVIFTKSACPVITGFIKIVLNFEGQQFIYNSVDRLDADMTLPLTVKNAVRDLVTKKPQAYFEFNE